MQSLNNTPQYAVYANLVKNGILSLAQVPKEYRSYVEALVVSDVPFDINGELANAASSSIVEYKTIHEFPNIGIGNRLYIDKQSNKAYRWDSDKMVYSCIQVDVNLDDINIDDLSLGVIDCGDSTGEV